MPATPAGQLACESNAKVHNASLWIPAHHAINVQALKTMRNLPKWRHSKPRRDAYMFSQSS